MSLEQRCKNAGIELHSETGVEKWKIKVKQRIRYRWFFKIKDYVLLMIINGC